ncbi:putative HNHc nuclease [Dethiothermospora halolimnae]|uniref:putative HNHc nuclease n=1 Tax=Dethiothermospora halolimnae TaxID=3114390 RepID=UPI003CCBD560
MFYHTKITGIKETEKGTELLISIPGKGVKEEILRNRNKKGLLTAELIVDDNRSPSSEQIAKFYATIGDIAKHTGHAPEFIEMYIKYMFCKEKGLETVSMSKKKGTMSLARELITYLIEFCFREDIPTLDTLRNRNDDINAYLYLCLKYRKCAICNKKGQMHHWQAIGMGNNSKKIDDSDHEKMCLCEDHHLFAKDAVHRMGKKSFEDKYHIYGIKYKE